MGRFVSAHAQRLDPQRVRVGDLFASMTRRCAAGQRPIWAMWRRCGSNRGATESSAPARATATTTGTTCQRRVSGMCCRGQPREAAEVRYGASVISRRRGSRPPRICWVDSPEWTIVAPNVDRLHSSSLRSPFHIMTGLARSFTCRSRRRPGHKRRAASSLCTIPNESPAKSVAEII